MGGSYPLHHNLQKEPLYVDIQVFYVIFVFLHNVYKFLLYVMLKFFICFMVIYILNYFTTSMIGNHRKWIKLLC
jgi:hypothetical protein